MVSYRSKVGEQAQLWSGYFVLLLGLLLALAVLRTALFAPLPESERVWAELTLLLLIALVAERLVQQWKQPFVLVLLLLGVLISPHTLSIFWPPVANALQAVLASPPLSTLLSPLNLHPSPDRLPRLVEDGQLLQAFAQLGAILLLLRTGLHSKLDAVFNLPNLIVALGGVLLPFALGYAYILSIGGSDGYALFAAAALTATSVGITAAVLAEQGVLSKPFAQMILGAAVIDDILALMVLSIVKAAPLSGSAAAVSVAPLLAILFIAAAFIFGGLALGRLFMRRFFATAEKELSKSALAALLAVVFFYAFAAQALGLSAIVGAFLAGLVISESHLAQALGRALFPLEALFTPIFFLSLGLLVDIAAIPALLIPLLSLTFIAVVGKVAGCGLAARPFGLPWKEALTVGWGMVPRGEIALIIALLGTTTLGADGQPILSAAQYTLIAAMAFLTTLIVPAGLAALLRNQRG